MIKRPGKWEGEGKVSSFHFTYNFLMKSWQIQLQATGKRKKKGEEKGTGVLRASVREALQPEFGLLHSKLGSFVTVTMLESLMYYF